MPSFLTAPAAPRLLAGFGTAALVAGVGLFASSRPAHTAGGPIPVTVANAPLYAVTRDADNPARQPVQVVKLLTGTQNDDVIDADLYTVPAGKRLVIDYVSSSAVYRPDNNSYNFLVIGSQSGDIVYASFNELPDTALYSAVSQKIELFSDPGTTVRVSVFPNNKNAANIYFTLVGHLVDL